MKIKRIMSYIVDIFFVSFISSLIIMIPIFKYDNNTIEEQNEAFNELFSNFYFGSSDPDEDIIRNELYELEKKTSTLTIITAFVTFIYFGVFAYINNGQTIGKKLFKIKVVANTDERLNPGLFIIRTLLITNVLPSTISILSLNILSQNNWYNLTNIITEIHSLLIFITLCSIIIRSDERGIHDLICKTKVIATENR